MLYPFFSVQVQSTIFFVRGNRPYIADVVYKLENYRSISLTGLGLYSASLFIQSPLAHLCMTNE